MLLNAKPKELIKYSKGSYNKELFIQDVKEHWELTDKQIRMTFLIADLAVNAEGVFSVSNEKFREMFETRFKMTISRSTVIRFFQLLEELNVLSINEGRRKNKQQSANIFIIDQSESILNDREPLLEPIETLDETPHATAAETLDDTHNIAFNNTLNKAIKEPLNNIVNKPVANESEIIGRLTAEFIELGLNENVILKVISEAKSTEDVKNFGGYLRTCLENTLYKVEMKIGKINKPSKAIEQEFTQRPLFYNWLDEVEDPEAINKNHTVLQACNNHPLFYDWLNG